MKAMILAAGRGERMRPLTEDLPKPLLEVAGRPLIEHHLEKLAQAGVRDIVINHARLGHLIEAALGDGSRYGVRIQYSPEGEEALETGGGIYRALSLLGDEPFVVANADVWSDFSYSSFPRDISGVAHLVLVPNPKHHPNGDFGLRDGHVEVGVARPQYTYSGLGVYHRRLFEGCQPERFPLAPLICDAAARGRVTGELYLGYWVDVGNPERLRQLQTLLAEQS